MWAQASPARATAVRQGAWVSFSANAGAGQSSPREVRPRCWFGVVCVGEGVGAVVEFVVQLGFSQMLCPHIPCSSDGAQFFVHEKKDRKSVV
mmetsp:Transcript_69598/g.185298  ORF Transcript_69598/g.185298 Transcript_69598/m.185298 type:complete len:92 (-) Transcript_69598:3-278(-)